VNNLTAAELMTRKVLSARPDWTVAQLMEFLTDNAISGVVVVGEDDNPIGVVSQTDITRNATVAERTNRGNGLEYFRRLEDFVGVEELQHFHVNELDPELTVRDIMTPMVFAVEQSAKIQEVAEMMITGRIHRVFVKQDGKLTGIITAMDLLPLIRDM
jgi:CBS domain-containing protein